MVARICSLPGVMVKGTFALIPALSAWRATLAARCRQTQVVQGLNDEVGRGKTLHMLQAGEVVLGACAGHIRGLTWT
jgi:hypothetical protein